MSAGSPRLDFTKFISAARALGDTLYIGPFRNAINVGANESYFDIQTGDAFMNAWQSLKTGRSRSANEATWRLTRDIQQIFGFDDFEMNVSPEQKTLQLFVNG